MSRYLAPGIHIDAIHVVEVADGHSAAESVSVHPELTEWLRLMQNRSGDNASHWYISQLMVICGVVFHSPPDFLTNVFSTLLPLFNARLSSIHVWGIRFL